MIHADFNTVLEAGDPEELTQLELAQKVGDALNKAYPNHPWVIGFQGGGIVVRHLAIAGAVANTIGKEGFSSLLPKHRLGTPDEIRDSCITFGGELLEAFDLPRGAWDGREPTVPKAWRYRQTSNFT
jgi:hypothetical protein